MAPLWHMCSFSHNLVVGNPAHLTQNDEALLHNALEVILIEPSATGASSANIGGAEVCEREGMDRSAGRGGGAAGKLYIQAQYPGVCTVATVASHVSTRTRQHAAMQHSPITSPVQDLHCLLVHHGPVDRYDVIVGQHLD